MTDTFEPLASPHLNDTKHQINEPLQDASNAPDTAVSAFHARQNLPQRQSLLLTLPTEFRLHICSYMTLSPASVDWNGVFFSFHQLHKDMLTQLHPDTDLKNCLQTIMARPPDCNRNTSCELKTGIPHTLFGWVRDVTIQVRIQETWEGPFYSLYSLYLDTLQISLTGDINPPEHQRGAISIPYGDLKTIRPPCLLDGLGTTMNCKKITLTLDELATVDDARDKEISYHLTMPGTKIIYLFTICVE